MSKQSLLLVDGDARSLRVLEVSLRKAGFMVTSATSVQDALGKLELHAPDLIISETAFGDGDGFELRRRVRATTEWAEIPFIFLTAEAAIENKIRGLELGVDDYLTKPIYIKEIVTRINILLQKRQRTRLEERRDGRTRFAGRVQDMPVVDVIQTIEISRKSGVIQFEGERGRQAAIYFREGRVIDAEAGVLQGEDAVYRLLTWSEGEFEVVFRTVRRREVITTSSQALLMEGMRRLDEWSRLLEQLPALTHRFEVDIHELALRLGDVPDDNNRILRLFDGKRTLLEVIDASDAGDLECLQAVSRLYFEELLLDLDHDKAPRKEPAAGPPQHDASVPAVADAVELPQATATDGAFAALEAAEPSTAEIPEDTAPGFAVAELGPDEPVPDDIGPLTGGYRLSSLRKIDEAVAAAQAIDPSLFDEDTPVGGPIEEPSSRNGAAHDHAGYGESPAARYNGAFAPDRSGPVRSDREESGLRMIGSLGRDHAEASGELASLTHSKPRRSETARELVTILPRRVSQAIPAASVELPEELAVPLPTPTSPMLESVSAPALEPPQQARVPLPGTGVHAPSRSRRLLRIVSPADGRGPGLGPMLLIVLAVVLAGTALVLRLRRHSHSTQKVEAAHEIVRSARATDSPTPGQITEPTPPPSADRETPDTAASPEERPGSASGDRDPFAAPRATPAGSAGSAEPRQPNPPTKPAGAALEATRNAEAKALFDRATTALEAEDFTRALELAKASLRARRTARTYLLRAQAEQRLERVDDALASVDAAGRLAPNFATVWEMRGRILWSARRRDEARAAFERFLALEPDSPKAPSVRRLINEPR